MNTLFMYGLCSPQQALSMLSNENTKFKRKTLYRYHKRYIYLPYFFPKIKAHFHDITFLFKDRISTNFVLCITFFKKRMRVSAFFSKVGFTISAYFERTTKVRDSSTFLVY